MPIKVRDQGATRGIAKISVRVGGTLRPIKSVRVMRGGALRRVFGSDAAMSADCNPPVVFGYAFQPSPAPVLVASDPTTATVAGGAGPYTYAWQVVDGFAQVASPNMATTTFSEVLNNDTPQSTAQCLVADALGNTVICACFITLTASNGN